MSAWASATRKDPDRVPGCWLYQWVCQPHPLAPSSPMQNGLPPVHLFWVRGELTWLPQTQWPIGLPPTLVTHLTSESPRAKRVSWVNACIQPLRFWYLANCSAGSESPRLYKTTHSHAAVSLEPSHPGTMFPNIFHKSVLSLHSQLAEMSKPFVCRKRHFNPAVFSWHGLCYCPEFPCWGWNTLLRRNPCITKEIRFHPALSFTSCVAQGKVFKLRWTRADMSNT